MSYSDFLSLIRYGIDLFVDNIGNVANSLMNNYIFITLLGLGIFCSLFIMFVNFVLDKIYSKRDKLDEYLDRKESILLTREVIKDINSKIDKSEAEPPIDHPINTAKKSELHK